MNTKNSFKKLLTLVIVAMALLSLSGTLKADTFSINFYSNFAPFAGPDEWVGKLDFQTLDENDVDQDAGYDTWLTNGWLDVLVPWNMPDPIVPVTITSDQGSTATFTFTNTRNGWSLGNPVETGVGNDEMMNASAWGTEDGEDEGVPALPEQILDITLSDIPFAAYDVICYFGAQEGQWIDGTAKFVLNGETEQDIVVLNGYQNGTFTEIVDSVGAGNFMIFKGLTDPTLTIQMWGNGFQHVGLCGLQLGSADPNAPTVNSGPDMVTWADTVTGVPVDLVGIAINNDTEIPQRDLTWIWTVVGDPNETVDLDPVTPGEQRTSTSLTPTVTVVKVPTSDEETKITLKLSATLAGFGTLGNTMSLYVYGDPCKASVGKGITRHPSDLHGEDCDTDADDLALVLEKWLNNYSLTEPVHRP